MDLSSEDLLVVSDMRLYQRAFLRESICNNICHRMQSAVIKLFRDLIAISNVAALGNDGDKSGYCFIRRLNDQTFTRLLSGFVMLIWSLDCSYLLFITTPIISIINGCLIDFGQTSSMT